MAERLMSPEDAARKFNNAFVHRSWTVEDMALFDVRGTDAFGNEAWVARVWLPIRQIEPEDAVVVYWQTNACVELDMRRLSPDAQAAALREILSKQLRVGGVGHDSGDATGTPPLTRDDRTPDRR